MTEEQIAWIVVVVLTAALVLWLCLTRWFSAVLGTPRADVGQPILPWAAAVFLGGVVWLASQLIYVVYLTASRTSASPGTTLPTTNSADFEFAAHELAIASTVPPFLGAAAMLLAALVKGDWLVKIGLCLRLIPRGLGQAVVGLVLAYPLVFWTLQGVERLYRMIDFEHPREHELLQKLTESGTDVVRLAMLIGAVIAAPLFEELLFRGGLQTLVRWGMTRWMGRERLMCAWASILIVSLLFASIHPLWMAPAILVLSVCIGYLYERTANLWACIFMHAMFNGLNTVMYLAQS
ncbi:MAG TPA: CPBP family intramembrane metalloprotease [Tepidisphaeraceae bacterium]|nr:CPBP family intramembrane metalloprotease [Tepidisphaeraceae bacterium]